MAKLPRTALLEPFGSLDPQQRHQQQGHQGGAQPIEGRPEAAVDLAGEVEDAAIDESGLAVLSPQINASIVADFR